MAAVLYQHATIITVNQRREIILDGAMLVVGTHIKLVDLTSAVLSHPDLKALSEIRIVDLSGKIVIPGFVNTHCHTIQSILRGLAEDLWLHPWMCDAIWPLEASYEEDDGYHAARLTAAELLKGGTTTFLEAMLTHRAGFENVVRAVGESGIRACLVSFKLFLRYLPDSSSEENTVVSRTSRTSKAKTIYLPRASSSNPKKRKRPPTSPMPATKTWLICRSSQPSLLTGPTTAPFPIDCTSGWLQEPLEDRHWPSMVLLAVPARRTVST